MEEIFPVLYYNTVTSIQSHSWGEKKEKKKKNFHRPNAALKYYEVLKGIIWGRDSSVGKATRYGLDGPGIEFRWGRDFPHPSRPALRPTQSPVQWVPGLSRG